MGVPLYSCSVLLGLQALALGGTGCSRGCHVLQPSCAWPLCISPEGRDGDDMEVSSVGI